MPFWVLDPICFIDPSYPVTWIPTWGTFPHNIYNNRLDFANKCAKALDVEGL
jgi:hypothetical protein